MSASKETQIYNENVIHIDHETHEIKKETNFNVIKLPREPNYVKMYVDDIAALNSMSRSGTNILHAILARMDYEGYISLPGAIRIIISKQLGIKPQTFHNEIQKLVRKHIIQRVGRGLFEANPIYFAKGEWKDIYHRRKNFGIAMTMIYTESGKEIHTEIKKQPTQEK